MTSVSMEWEMYIDVQPPKKCHFHVDEVDNSKEQLAISGSWWTGKYHSLACLLKEVTYEAYDDDKNGEDDKVGNFHRLQLPTGKCCSDAKLCSKPCTCPKGSRISRINDLAEGSWQNSLKFSNEMLFSEGRLGPYQMMKLLKATDLFHRSLRTAIWDDFLELFSSELSIVC